MNSTKLNRMIVPAFPFNAASIQINKEPLLDRAVDFLLEHWTIRKPIGPCHYGIGTLFMQVEYPFRNYNLFIYFLFYPSIAAQRRTTDFWKP
jgi:hypothetical protein